MFIIYKHHQTHGHCTDSKYTSSHREWLRRDGTFRRRSLERERESDSDDERDAELDEPEDESESEPELEESEPESEPELESEPERDDRFALFRSLLSPPFFPSVSASARAFSFSASTRSAIPLFSFGSSGSGGPASRLNRSFSLSFGFSSI